jgi:peptidoglycan/xylan/chitin deacetylase (PgdA/CDA1 family)
LEEHKIHATFFIVGRNIKNKADLRKKAIKEGHQICNHTMKHLYTRTPEILEQDILEWENLYKETL